MRHIFTRASLLLLFYILFHTISAQDIVVGHKFHFFSQILDEDRELWVSLPQSYHDSLYAPAFYPVMYLLDPEFHFHSMVAVREALTKGLYNYMPEMIIVGIVNTDRSRDLTPTNSSVIHSGKKIHETSGGADAFLMFIEKELIPFINATYRTNEYRILNGHSFGGLFTLYALQHRPTCFNSYIVHDPSIWWDDKTLYKSAQQLKDTINLAGRCLYLSMAYNQTKEKDRFQHSQSILTYKNNILEAFAGNDLRYRFDYLSKEDHGTIFLPATYDALRYIYDGICLPIKEIPTRPDLLMEHYLQVSDSIRFQIKPPEKLVKETADYCLLRGEFQSAEKLLLLNVKNYPTSSYAYWTLGHLYLKMNKNELAKDQFQKAESLNPAMKTPVLLK